MVMALGWRVLNSRDKRGASGVDVDGAAATASMLAEEGKTLNCNEA